MVGLSWPLVHPGRSFGAAQPGQTLPDYRLFQGFQHLNYEDTADFVAESGLGRH